MNRPSWRSSVLIYYKVYKFIKYITVIVIRPVTECTVYILLKNENVYHFICEKVVSIYSPIWRRRAFFSRNKRKMYYLSGDWVIVWWHPVHEVGLRFALFPNGCNFCQTQKKNIYFPKIANTLYARSSFYSSSGAHYAIPHILWVVTSRLVQSIILLQNDIHFFEMTSASHS